jgi:signal transduction histidine kinase
MGAMFVALFGSFTFYLRQEVTRAILNDARLNATNGFNHEVAQAMSADDFVQPTSARAMDGFSKLFRDLESRGFVRLQIINSEQELLSDSRMELPPGEVLPLTTPLSRALAGQSFYENEVSGSYGRHVDFYIPYALSFADGDVSGVVIATMSSAASQTASLFHLEKTYLLLGLGLAVLLLVNSLYFLSLVIKPLNDLGLATISVGKGNFQTKIPKKDDQDEIGGLAKQFDVMRQSLAELDEAKSSFVSIAAHQLKAPLTSIRWMTELMATGEAGPLNDDQKEYAAQVHGGVLRLIDTVDLFLALTRLEQGRLKIAPEPMDLSELANSVVKELGPLATERGLVVSVTAPASP